MATKNRKMFVTQVKPPLIELDVAIVIKIGALLPFASIVSCVLTSVLLHFEESTRTHCHVANYLPSISAATGGFTPEKYIWRFGIGYHSSIRILFTIVEYQVLRSRCIGKTTGLYKWFTMINAVLCFVENLALVTLTYVSSSDNYSIHEKSFIVFMVFSMLHMLITCILYYKTCQSPASYDETISLRRKVTSMLVNYLSFGAAVYVFFRHNSYCEPGVYSLFALFEYVTVFSNIIFHYTITHDLRGHKFTLGPSMVTTNKQH
ncbi:post-GPI attachment to proteins factor 2-like [Exaiptasia diaphana]|uniref:CWH43-like N-terminal domain-containing protein n=1 Tax=Exaiptasia diaphana TaxID=2652724 RepID=A0A913X7V6_EXADI|nr:post-GPI attachment to proteins factor 2-like [Exaiptasia diaphana]